MIRTDSGIVRTLRLASAETAHRPQYFEDRQLEAAEKGHKLQYLDDRQLAAAAEAHKLQNSADNWGLFEDLGPILQSSPVSSSDFEKR